MSFGWWYPIHIVQKLKKQNNFYNSYTQTFNLENGPENIFEIIQI